MASYATAFDRAAYDADIPFEVTVATSVPVMEATGLEPETSDPFGTARGRHTFAGRVVN